MGRSYTTQSTESYQENCRDLKRSEVPRKSSSVVAVIFSYDLGSLWLNG